MPRLGLADQQELLRWADSSAARGDLPRLVRRLVLETGQGVVDLDFPGGEGVGSGGWDGTVRATHPAPHVPAGVSLWELSVEAKVGTKANSDYAKRTTAPDSLPTASCTYVAVSPRRWGQRRKWAETKRADGRWGDVRAYGVDELETWIESAPITHAWLSELLGLGPFGLVAAETWWSSWTQATRPHFPLGAVLAGRSEAVAAVQTRLDGPGQITVVEAAGAEDVLAFVCAMAAMRAGSDAGRLLARTAIINNAETGRRLRNHESPLVLIPSTPELADDLRGSRHHVIVATVGSDHADVSLPPIDPEEARTFLETAGLDEDQRQEVARVARLSLIASRRLIATSRALHQPPWAKPPVSRLVRRATLLGRWRETSSSDTSAVGEFCEAQYDLIRDDIARLTHDSDPLLARVDTTIGVVSTFDAWLLVRGGLLADDLHRFRDLTFRILGELDPRLDIPPADRWQAALLGKIQKYLSASTEKRGNLSAPGWQRNLAVVVAVGNDRALHRQR